ncbi:MAG TPA: class I SAM-dependent methyltransferase [bacterium]|jgi:SAM-dependent methyltransferase|nr:class I SAM-dependent methyltransferase [bacterium]
MFTKSAQFYDAIYAAIGKDYAAEAVRLHDLIQTHTRSGGNALLDLACGTGAHLAELRRWYDVEGLDLDPQMLAIAAQRVPGVPLHQGDLADFSLPRSFDAVICLFSSIGYVKTDVRLKQALRTMARHTVSGGIVIVEPWILPDRWETGHVGAVFVDEPKLKIARINTSERRDTLTTLEFHYLVGTPDQVVYFTEDHELGLFTHEQYLDAFRAAGLEPSHDAEGLMGRGLYYGVRPT